MREVRPIGVPDVQVDDVLELRTELLRLMMKLGSIGSPEWKADAGLVREAIRHLGRLHWERDLYLQMVAELSGEVVTDE